MNALKSAKRRVLRLYRRAIGRPPRQAIFWAPQSGFAEFEAAIEQYRAPVERLPGAENYSRCYRIWSDEPAATWLCTAFHQWFSHQR